MRNIFNFQCEHIFFLLLYLGYLFPVECKQQHGDDDEETVVFTSIFRDTANRKSLDSFCPNSAKFDQSANQPKQIIQRWMGWCHSNMGRKALKCRAEEIGSRDEAKEH